MPEVNLFPLSLITLLYWWQSFNFFAAGQVGIGIAFLCWGLANLGFFVAVWWR